MEVPVVGAGISPLACNEGNEPMRRCSKWGQLSPIFVWLTFRANRFKGGLLLQYACTHNWWGIFVYLHSICCNQVGLAQISLVKVWPKFPKVFLENGDATRHAYSFSFINRYEVYVAASVLDETCPVLGNIPSARSGQIWAGTASTLHIERTDIMHRSHKPPNMTTWSI